MLFLSDTHNLKKKLRIRSAHVTRLLLFINNNSLFLSLHVFYQFQSSSCSCHFWSKHFKLTIEPFCSYLTVVILTFVILLHTPFPSSLTSDLYTSYVIFPSFFYKTLLSDPFFALSYLLKLYSSGLLFYENIWC